jgi:hypothetical protein
MAERSTSNRDILFTALAGVMGPTSHGSAERILTSHESNSTNLTSHEEEESVDSISSLQIFYSQDRWLREHESLRFISAGSMEICRAKMSLEVMRKGEILVVRADGKLDTCGSVCVTGAFLLHEGYSPV